MTPKLRVGVVGMGAWGKRIIETLGNKTQHCYCAWSISRTPENTLRVDKPDFVVIATPFKSHAAYMRLCLEARVPFIVEKPAASYTELVELQREFENPLMLCNHTLLFNPAIEALYKSMVYQIPAQLRGEHGGPGPIRDDCSPLLDYGAHGIALALWLSGASHAVGLRVQATPEHGSGAQSYQLDASFAHLALTLRVSNKYEFKRLKYTTVTLEGPVYRFDDRDEHKLYRYSGPELSALPYQTHEPLTNALDTFAQMVRRQRAGETVTDARFGWNLPIRVMRTLESAAELVRVQAVEAVAQHA